MFDIACQLMIQLIDILPAFIGLYLVFDFLGSMLFSNK